MNGLAGAPLTWEPQRRIPALDALRGLAALAVVVHHAALQRLPIAHHAVFSRDAGLLDPVLFWMGGWGVTLFFVLSGFCIHLPQARREQQGSALPGWRDFYQRRAWRLVPTHYASLALAMLAAWFLPTTLISRPTVTTFVAHLFMVHTWLGQAAFYSINAVFWSIAVEVHFYLAYPALRWLRKRLRSHYVFALLGIGVVAYLIAALPPPGDARFVLQNLFLVTWWQWGLGAILADIYVRGEAGPAARYLVFPGATWCWGLLSLAVAYADPTLAGVHIRPWLSPLLCAALLFSVAVGPGRARVRPLEWVGGFSYSLYLVHPVALAVTIYALPLATMPALPALAIDLVASLGLSQGFFFLVERHFLNNPSTAVRAIGTAAPAAA